MDTAALRNHSYVVGAFRILNDGGATGRQMAIVVRDLHTDRSRVGARRAIDPDDQRFPQNIENDGVNIVPT